MGSNLVFSVTIVFLSFDYDYNDVVYEVDYFITTFYAITVFVHILRTSRIPGAFANSEEVLTEENYNKTWIYFANGRDLPEVALLKEPSKARTFKKSDDPIEFELYTRKFSKSPIVAQYTQRKKRELWSNVIENFDPDRDTKIIVHGWKSNSRSEIIQTIKDEYLKRDEYNVLAVNWEHQAANNFYLFPARYTKTVGRAVATMIDAIVEEKHIDPKRIHLIGHSLGAHTMGYAGSYTKYRVSRITGLDPAMPAFEYIAGPESHLDVTDAEFVDVIHTCAGVFGYLGPIGHVDFYPNSGKPPQPGCEGLSNITSACSHGRSYRFFAESINSPESFYGYPCDNWNNFTKGRCQDNPIPMGDNVPNEARGVFYLVTRSAVPFGVGKTTKYTNK